MTTEQKTNGKTPGYAVILSMLAIIGGVYAMIQPMTQRIDFLERQMQESKEEVNKKYDRLDNSLKREMLLLNDIQDGHVQCIHNELKEIVEWQKTHDEQYPPDWLCNKVDTLEEWVYRKNTEQEMFKILIEEIKKNIKEKVE